MLMRHHPRGQGDGSGIGVQTPSTSSGIVHRTSGAYSMSAMASCSSSSQEDLYPLDVDKRDCSDDEDLEDEEEDDAPTPVNEGMAANGDFHWLRQPSQVPEAPATVQDDPSATMVRPKYRHSGATSPLHHHHHRHPSHQQLVPWQYESCYGCHQGSYARHHLHPHHHLPAPPLCCCTYEEYGSTIVCGRGYDYGVTDRTRRHSHHGIMEHGPACYLPSVSPSYGTFPTCRKMGCSPTPRSSSARQRSSPGLTCRDSATYYDAHQATLVLPTIGSCDKQTNVLGGDVDDWQDKVHQLHLEKENLMLQVSVLSEQVEAQAEKIRELEIALDAGKEQLDGTEDMLQQEMVSRSQLENSKLDLLEQVSDFKKKVSMLEQERIEQSDRCKKLEAEVIITKGRLVEREAELTTLRARLARNGTVTPTIIDQYSEIDKLRQALDSVIATKEEREKKIEELTLQVSRQKRVQDWLPHDRRSSDPSSPEANLNSLYSPSGDSNRSESRLLEKPPPVPRLTSTPVNLSPSYGTASQGNEHRYSPSPSHSSLQSAYKASSTENVTPSGTRTPPAKRHYSTIPRQHGLQVLQQIQQELQQHKMDNSSVNNGSLPSSPSNIVPPPPSQSQSHHNLTHPSLEVFLFTSVVPCF